MSKMVYLMKDVVKMLNRLQTQNERSGDEDSDLISEEENLPVFDWIINKKLLNGNLEEVVICKHCKMYLYWQRMLIHMRV